MRFSRHITIFNPSLTIFMRHFTNVKAAYY